MVKKFMHKHKSLLRSIVGVFGCTVLLFTFQACPPYNNSDVYGIIHGTITSKSTGMPINGIRINDYSGGTVDNAEGGIYSLDLYSNPPYRMTFIDIDSTDSFQYKTIDTIINPVFESPYDNPTSITYYIEFNVEMEVENETFK